LVLSSPYGQCGLTTDPLQIFTEFPAMISESEGKAKGIKLLETIQEMESELKDSSRKNMKAEIQKKIAETLLRFNANLEQTEFREDTFVEIRFKTDRLAQVHKIELELIFEMQNDPLISQTHTPQTQASVRIVLGTLKELVQQADESEASKKR
jgi:hypothetical protein